MRPALAPILAVVVLLLPLASRAADDVGRVKSARGSVTIERGAARLPATVGLTLQEGDVIVTGRDGAAGITFKDDSLLSVGPDSVLSVDRFAFDSTTHAGRFDSSLRRGTLSAVSGKIARQSPDAMSVRTPSTILGVRGTEFVVRVIPVTP
jgi:hypothetical protein